MPKTRTMGSGSSKEENSPKKPVANVNKTSHDNNNVNNSLVEKKIAELSDHREKKQITGTGKSSPVSVKSGKLSAENKGNSNWKIPGFGADSDEEEDVLNEVLRIPTKPANDKKQEEAQQTVEYPETYAQRKQREKYTLNQQQLLRQKTIYRNPSDWQNEDEQEEYTGGFDANKFRQANQGMQNNKNAIFSTTKSDVEPVYTYDQGELEEMDIRTHQNKQTHEMPVYNASEQDLMALLEKELF